MSDLPQPTAPAAALPTPATGLSTPAIASLGLPPGLSRVATLGELFAWRVAYTPDTEAYRQFDAATQSWQSLTWAQAQRQVQRWMRALQAEGLPAGTRVALLVPNGVDHVCMDLAALSLGLVPVPMHALDNAASIAYILADSQAAVLLCDTVERWLGITAAGEVPATLRRVVTLTEHAGAADARIVSLSAWLAAGEAAPALAEPTAAPAAESLAAVVYTSGTTGRPKGVMLTHGNVLSNVRAILQRLPMHGGDVLLSFLPLSHTFERTAGYYLPIAAGAAVAYARSVAQLQEDLRIVRPTVLISVPRIYERIYAKVQESVAQGHPIGRKLLAWAEEIGWSRFMAEQHDQEPGLAERLAWRALEPIVARQVLEAFGGRLRVAVAGGAPLAPHIAHFFLGMGLNLLQGYGMTETSPVVSCNTVEDNVPASVGRPLPGVEVRIGESDELLVRGPTVMRGYLNREDDTRRVLEPDGWLHTGDRARIEDGRLYITGRIKDIIVTSTGEKIAPVDLEQAIEGDPLFAQTLVIGEQRPFLAVLAVVDKATWHHAAREAGLVPDAPGVLESPEAERLAIQRIAQRVRSFPAYATPKRVWLTDQPWTIDAGLMTPTLKLKRKNLETRFAAQIEQLYRKG
ncbi:MAG: AMP-dependent synthetase/ligase [Pseudomonadota bacterium]